MITNDGLSILRKDRSPESMIGKMNIVKEKRTERVNEKAKDSRYEGNKWGRSMKCYIYEGHSDRGNKGQWNGQQCGDKMYSAKKKGEDITM